MTSLPDHEETEERDDAALAAALSDLALTAARRRAHQLPAHVDVQDVAQLATVRVLDQIRSQDLELESRGAYLSVVVRNLVIDIHRKESRRRLQETRVEQLEPWIQESVADSVDFNEAMVTQQLVRELIEMADEVLSPRQLEAFQALVTSGGSVRDGVELLANTTGLSQGAIRTHLDRALTKLREASGWDPEELFG